jgi:hypothetical protein
MLKQRFLRMDANLRDELETLGREMQKCTVKVKKWKKLYANFVVHVGSDPYIVKSIMVKNDLNIPNASKDNP